MELCSSLREAIEGSDVKRIDIARSVEELDRTLHQVLDTVLLQAMVRDIIHEVYAPRMERVDVCSLLRSTQCLEAGDLYPIISKPDPFPLIIFDPKILRCIHQNAMINAVKYGKKWGKVTTEIAYDKPNGKFQMKIINVPGKSYAQLLALGHNAQEEVFFPGKRLHVGFNSQASDTPISRSTGEGAWISQKCAKLLGGSCKIFFKDDSTVFAFDCPVTVADVVPQISTTNVHTLELPTNTVGIALDDSNIQRKLLTKVFTILGIPLNKQVVKGSNFEEITNFKEDVTNLINSDPTAYYLLIVDENLDVQDARGSHRTISGSELVLKLRNELDPELETRLLSLVRSANDSLTDVAIYMTRSHGFFPKAPISRDKVLEIIGPLWRQRFPAPTPIANLPAPIPRREESDSESIIANTEDLIQNLHSIETICSIYENRLSEVWLVIWEKLHVLKGDLLCLNESNLISHAAQSIELLRSPTIPNDFLSKWRAIKALVEAELKSN
jgi:hypothetical protein